MKKIIGVIVSLSLILALIPVVYAGGTEPNILSVSTPQIDNQVYKYGETVRVICENTEFTKTGVDIDIMYSTVETVSNIQIIDDYTVEFELRMFQAAVSNYGLKLIIPQKIGAAKQIMYPHCIEVREGHMDFRFNPITTDKITDVGITVEILNAPETVFGMKGIFEVDGVDTKYSSIGNSTFRVYPELQLYKEKAEIEIRFIYHGLYYKKVLHVVDNEMWIDPPSVARTAPKSFSIKTLNLDFSKDMTVIITGKGRYINLKDITWVDSNQLDVFTPLPLVAGTYDVHVSWPSLKTTYVVPLVITKSVVQSDIDLDEAVTAAVYDTHGKLDLMVDNALLQYYMASKKKFIDFSDMPLGEFYLLIKKEAVKTLVNAGRNLDIVFENCSISVAYETLALWSDNEPDPYVVLKGGMELENPDINYFAPVPGIYTDTNLKKFELSVPKPNNLFSFSDIKVIHDCTETERTILSASESQGKLVCNASATGIYQFALKGRQFIDFSNNHWSAKYVYRLTALGIIDGMGDGTFQAESLVTNAQFTKLVSTAVSLKTGVANSGFADVDMNGWYYPYVCAMEAAGILNGAYFNPNKPISRLNMAKAVVRAYAYYTGSDITELAAKSDDTFMDIASLSIENRNYIKAAYVLGIINGMSSTSFAPLGNATRAHASAMICRLLEALDIT